MEIFDQAGGSFETFVEKVKSEGKILDNEQIAMLNRQRARIDEFSENIKGVFRTAVSYYLGLYENLKAADVWRGILTDLQKFNGLSMEAAKNTLHLVAETGNLKDAYSEMSASIKANISFRNGLIDGYMQEVKAGKSLSENDKARLSRLTVGNVEAEKQLMLLEKRALELGLIQKLETGVNAEANNIPVAKVSEFSLAWDSVSASVTDNFVMWRTAIQTTVDATTDMMSNMLMSTVDKTHSMRNAYQSFFKSVAKMAADLMAKRAMADLIGIFAGAATDVGSVKTGNGGSVKIHAEGGISTGHLNFIGPMASGGVVNKASMAVIGEGSSPEAIVPMPNGRSIPVQLNGGGKNVNVSFTIVANDTQGFDQLLMKRRETITGLIKEAMTSDRDFRRAVNG